MVEGHALVDRGTGSARKLILFELNEVPLRVVERYMEQRPQSFLARRWAGLKKFRTFTKDRGHLHPWVTWPTFHRGVDNTEHGLAHLGQPVEPVEARLPSLWRILADHGVRTGVFGSLHSWAMPANVADYAFYLPDYFATSDRAYPPSLVDFQAFNLSMSRRSAGNVDVGLPIGPARRFLKKAVPLGVRAQTLFEAALQVASERVRPARKFRRRDLQAVIMADVFAKQLETTRPDFATFFTNNVAASMHRFWAATFPEDYKELPLSAEWRSSYRDAIFASLGSMDAVLERLARFVDRNPDYRLLIASSMGQVAIPIKPHPIFFTIVDLEKFMDQMGVAAGEWSEGAVMVPHRCVTVVPEKRELFRSRLDSLVVCGQRMKFQKEEIPPLGYDVADDGYFHLAIQFDERTDAEVRLGNEPKTAQEVGLGPFRMEEGLNTGYHHAEGMALLYDPVASHADESPRDVSTTDFAPSILRSFGISSPDYMKGDDRHLAA